MTLGCDEGFYNDDNDDLSRFLGVLFYGSIHRTQVLATDL